MQYQYAKCSSKELIIKVHANSRYDLLLRNVRRTYFFISANGLNFMCFDLLKFGIKSKIFLSALRNAKKIDVDVNSF